MAVTLQPVLAEGDVSPLSHPRANEHDSYDSSGEQQQAEHEQPISQIGKEKQDDWPGHLQQRREAYQEAEWKDSFPKEGKNETRKLAWSQRNLPSSQQSDKRPERQP